MALIILTIQDDPEGNVTVNMQMEPAVPQGTTTFTNAQRMAAVALNAVNSTLESEANSNILTPDKPKIEIVTGGKLPKH